MVAAAADDTDARTAIFANIDLLTQVATLVLQALVTGRIMKRFGVSVALVLLPIVVSLGFVGLAMAASFAVLVLFEASFRAAQRAITRPARETLFTVVTREEKYKSKAFTDTFVYRGGDVVGAWTEGGLRAIGLGLVGLASVAIPLAVVWAGLGLWLGRQQTRLTASRTRADEQLGSATAGGAALSKTAL
jgi:AAA family ATP:ADP antiporter